MAQSSGTIGGGLIHETFSAAEFTHAASGFRYSVAAGRGGLTLEFSKADGSLHGVKELAYFVGSGVKARSYALSNDGYLYEAPVAYYANGARWALAPAYDGYAYPYLTRPMQPGCLTCHASYLQPAVGAQNRFAGAPFREGGVACERCHGAGEAHLAKMKSGKLAGAAEIVNPAKLPADRRDSVCAQCHLSGDVRVMRPGADWRSFHAGDRLSESMTVFVKAGTTAAMKVTGHAEQLAQSACKRVSGDKLWCGSCHDAHSVPKPAEAAAFFRARCQTCHNSAACKETRAARAARSDDCAGCHMPKSSVTDAAHVTYTDHSVPRRPRGVGPAPARDAELIAFGAGAAPERDLAVAYAIMASRERSAAIQAKALPLLQKAERANPNDVEVLVQLADLYRTAGNADAAAPLYRRAIELDPSQVTAPVGLGGIMMERGQFSEAIPLWEDALSKNAGLELVRTNLAMAYLRIGDVKSAEAHLKKAVELSPGFAAAADLLRRLR